MVIHARAMSRILRVAAIFASGVAHAGDITWTGPDFGNWNVGGNWSGGVVPEPDDNVTIAGGTVSVNDARVVNGSFTLSDDSLLVVGTSNGSLVVNGPAQIDNSRIQSSGAATLDLHTVTSYTWSLCDHGKSLISTGGLATIDLSGLRTITINPPDCDGFQISVFATGSGMIDLSGLESIVAGEDQLLAFDVLTLGAIDFSSLAEAEGMVVLVDADITVDFPALTMLTGGTFITNPRGVISAGILTEARGISLTPGSSDSIRLPGLESLEDSSISVGDSIQFSLPSLETLNDVLLILSANGLFDAPELSTMTSSTGLHSLLASGGAMISAPKLTTMSNYIVSAVQGSVLDMSSLRTYTWDVCDGGVPFTASGAGTLVDLSGLTTMNFQPANCDTMGYVVNASEAGVLDLSGLRTIAIGGPHQVSFLSTGVDAEIDVSMLRTFPTAQVSFLELNSGRIIRFSGGGGGDGMMCAATSPGIADDTAGMIADLLLPGIALAVLALRGTRRLCRLPNLVVEECG